MRQWRHNLHQRKHQLRKIQVQKLSSQFYHELPMQRKLLEEELTPELEMTQPLIRQQAPAEAPKVISSLGRPNKLQSLERTSVANKTSHSSSQS
jgi:hypothetical protein